MATLEQLKTYLAEAETAYHQLMTGKMIVMVRDQNGEQGQYNQASKSALASYIAQLKQQIAELEGGAGSCGGPMGIYI